MKKLRFLLISVTLTASCFAQPPPIIKEYIARYKDIAVEEMIRTGVPASITLAQGIHETTAGTSPLVLKSNNHFGIKCKTEWRGGSVSHDDDASGECFRKYSSAIDSYKDHSDFLKTRAHYASLFTLDPTDYEAWAWGLKKAGYATNPKYPQVLIKLIRDYNLQDYSLIALGRKENTASEAIAGIETEVSTNESEALINTSPKKQTNYPVGQFKINETKVIFVMAGTSFLSIADQYAIPLSRIFEFNDMKASETATADQLIYLQRKRRTGANEFHIVEAGETLHDIAQLEGIRIESLLEYNFLKMNMKPKVGEQLYLHKAAPAMPKLFAMVQQMIQPSKEQKQTNTATNNDYISHIVQPKETMYAISKKYSLPVEEIMKWNDLETTELKNGQVLRIHKKD